MISVQPASVSGGRPASVFRFFRYPAVRLGTATLLFFAALGLAAALPGCKEHAVASAPPPPTVTVSTPMVREVVEWDEYIGNLAATETVKVRARVSGLLESVHFTDGQVVKEGDLLFKIDARPFQAIYDEQAGAVDKAKAQLANASVELQRVEETRASNAASGIEYETRKLARSQAQGELASAQAALVAAKLNLEFTEVRAPISGRISNRQVTPGNLITGGTGDATLLSTIESLNPIYCYVEADEASIQKYQRLSAEKKRVSARDARIPCFLSLGNENDFSREGYVDFVDNRLDPSTGTLRARGVFDNTDGRLIPGFFARLRLAGSGRFMATLIPDAAIGTDQGQKFVLIERDGVVHYQKVKLGALFGTLRAIEEGVTPQDRVIVNGTQLARPNGKVNAQLQPIPESTFKETAPGSPATQALPEQGGATTKPLDTRPAELSARLARPHARAGDWTVQLPSPAEEWAGGPHFQDAVSSTGGDE